MSSKCPVSCGNIGKDLCIYACCQLCPSNNVTYKLTFVLKYWRWIFSLKGKILVIWNFSRFDFILITFMTIKPKIIRNHRYNYAPYRMEDLPSPPKMACSQGNRTRSVSAALQQLHKDASAHLGHHWGPSLSGTTIWNKTVNTKYTLKVPFNVCVCVCYTLTIYSLLCCCLHEDATRRKSCNSRAGCCAGQHLQESKSASKNSI